MMPITKRILFFSLVITLYLTILSYSISAVDVLILNPKMTGSISGIQDIHNIKLVEGELLTITYDLQNFGEDGEFRVEATITSRDAINSWVNPIRAFTIVLNTQVQGRVIDSCNPIEDQRQQTQTRLYYFINKQKLIGDSSNEVHLILKVPEITRQTDNLQGIFIHAFKKCWKDTTPSEQSSFNPTGETDWLAFPLSINKGQAPSSSQPINPYVPSPVPKYLELCRNGVRDPLEADVDCGFAALCPNKCGELKHCIVDEDCSIGKCFLDSNLELKCLREKPILKDSPAPIKKMTCGNGVVDAGETCRLCPQDMKSSCGELPIENGGVPNSFFDGFSNKFLDWLPYIIIVFVSLIIVRGWK